MATIDEKLEALELEIYSFDDYGGLGGALEDEGTANFLNDETFGGAGAAGDFDFAGSTNQFLGREAYQQPKPAPQQQQPPPRSAWNSLDDDPLLSHAPVRQYQEPPKQKPAAYKTLEEIEAEMRQTATPPAQQPQRRALTVEEIEREMQAASIRQQPSPQPPPPQFPGQQLPPHLPPGFPQPGMFPPMLPPMMRGPFGPPGAMPPMMQQGRTTGSDAQFVLDSQKDGQPPSEASFMAQLGLGGPAGSLAPFAGLGGPEQEALMEKRKRKAAKIASMAKHNNLMSNSDKDFITRIQVSQLVTDNPYAEDFYNVVMTAIKQSRLGAGARPGLLAGGGRAGVRPARRETAMNRMAKNVQRLVENAKQKPRGSQLSVDGALGKIAIRTRSAPRPLLQISSNSPQGAGHAFLSGLIGGGDRPPVSGEGSEESPKKPAMTRREALAAVERIYDNVLELEQLQRSRPPPENEEGEAAWTSDVAARTEQLWDDLRVMEPLDTSSPHPFVSLIGVLKGKRVLARVMRHLSSEQSLTLFTLLLATFETLDVAADPYRQSLSKEDADRADTHVETFLGVLLSPVMSIVGNAQLRMVTGMLALLLDRNNILTVAKCKPGVAILTILLSRAESLKQSSPAPEQADLQQWQQTYNTLFARLVPDLPSLFPSTRAANSAPFGAAYYVRQPISTSRDLDREDEGIWQFLAALAVCADPQEQQTLVTSVREKVLENVTSAKTGQVAPELGRFRIANVNLFLRPLGLRVAEGDAAGGLVEPIPAAE